jgi:hypothetical protein
MRYRLRELGLEVRSEYAAKPTGATSGFLLNWIANQSRVPLAIDYGCGRLRYSIPLCSIADRVMCVDSKEQLEKVQIINGTRTTIVEYAKSAAQLHAMNIAEFDGARFKAKLIICINVLSAIPHKSERCRAIQRIASSLASTGICLFSVQHRNSDFDRVQSNGRARPYKDGYVINIGRRASFYGLLDREYISKMVVAAGLKLHAAFINGQSTYVIAGQQHSHSQRTS